MNVLGRRVSTAVSIVVISLLSFLFASSVQSAERFIDDKSQIVPLAITPNASSATLSAQELSSKIIEVESFGAVGDGLTDDTKAIQAALNYAAQNQVSVHCSKDKIYLVSSVMIKNGTKKFLCEGTLKGKGKSSRGILALDGPTVFKGVPVQDCVISVRIDMSAGDTYGIYADSCAKCIFENCYLHGFVDNGKKYGILLSQNSQYNKIRNNKVIGSFAPKDGQFLVMVTGNVLASGYHFGGYGKILRPTKPSFMNEISDNYCKYGTHGILLNGAERNTVTRNTCEGQSHRAIVLEPAWYNTISSNICLDYLSSAIILGYGSSHNLVNKNICKAGTSVFGIGGEASINCAIEIEGNRIEGNIIDAPKNYGIYMGIDCTGNVIENNEIKNYLRAGIALESDWVRPLPQLSGYSKPNYGPSPTGRWAYGNIEKNVVQNNIVDAPYRPGGCAIYLGQLGSSASLNNNTISGNTVRYSTNFKYYLYVFEESTGKLYGNVLTDNTFTGANPSQLYMSREKGHFSLQRNNGILKDVRLP